MAGVGIRGTGGFIAGLERDTAESRVILVAGGRESGELARSRDLAAEIVIGNIEIVEKTIGAKRSRNRAGEIVVREIENADRLQTSECVGEGPVRELCSRLRTTRYSMAPNTLGISPVREL